MFAGIARFVIRAGRGILVAAVLLTGLAGWYGAGVIDRLSNGGYTASTPGFDVADQQLRSEFGVRKPHLVLVLQAPGAIERPDIAAAGTAYTERLRTATGVLSAQSFWTTGDPQLRSRDGRSGVVLVSLAGDDDQAQRTAKAIVPGLTGDRPPFRVDVTGESEVNAELQERSDKALVQAELIAAPLVLLILLLVFRTLVAALLPVAIGAIGVVLTLAVLRLVTAFADVSIFALNLTTALGFGLAIDYSLFLLMRYREERDRGSTPEEAITVAVRRAGRTILFSSLTVALCLSALLLFPLYFLRSLAYAAIPVVLLVGAAAVLVLPAAVLVARRWLDAGDLTRLLRKGGRRGRSETRSWWGRIAAVITRRPLLIGLPVVAVLLLLAIPFTGVKFGLSDDRVLPRDAEAYRTARLVERDFDAPALNPVNVVVEGVSPDAAADFAARVSRFDGVAHVDGALGRYAAGVRVSPAAWPPELFTRAGTARLAVVTTETAFSPSSERVVDGIRAAVAPGPVFVSGDAALFADTKTVIAGRLPYALAVILVAMFVLLFLFTGSVLIPVKAILFNTLSLTASFGAMVYVFQDGHLRWLVGDFVVTGYLDVTIPVLMFCAAFGLSMDYEVFLMSRIREQYLEHRDNKRAVVEGVGRTGGIISAAAVLIGAVLLALGTSDISVLKLLGIGMFLAVLVDAVVIRGVLVPAFMVVAGRLNWWAPRPLRRIHAVIGITEEK